MSYEEFCRRARRKELWFRIISIVIIVLCLGKLGFEIHRMGDLNILQNELQNASSDLRDINGSVLLFGRRANIIYDQYDYLLDSIPQKYKANLTSLSFIEDVWGIGGIYRNGRIAILKGEGLTCLWHEIGHLVYNKQLNEEDRIKIGKVCDNTSVRITKYAHENCEENFAELFTCVNHWNGSFRNCRRYLTPEEINLFNDLLNINITEKGINRTHYYRWEVLR